MAASPCLDRDKRVASGGRGDHFVEIPSITRSPFEFDADARTPARIAADPPAAPCDTDRELVESSPCLFLVAPPRVVSRVRSHACPQCKRHIVPQVVARALEHWVEPVALLWTQHTGRIHPAHPRTFIHHTPAGHHRNSPRATGAMPRFAPGTSGITDGSAILSDLTHPEARFRARHRVVKSSVASPDRRTARPAWEEESCVHLQAYWKSLLTANRWGSRV